MKVTVVGCSGSYPGPDSSASCYLIEAAEISETEAEPRVWRVLLDLGNGAVGQLARYVDPLAIDAVFLSHLHADHCLDLCGYYVMRKYHPTGPQPRIPVYGPEGVAERMAAAYDLPPDPGMNEEFDFRTYDGPIKLGPLTISPIPVHHPVPAFGLRVQCRGVTIGYSGDTAMCEGVERVAVGTHLLLAEASFREIDDNPPGIHMTGADAGLLASRSGTRRLVLTHIPPWFDKQDMKTEATMNYSGPIELAAPGAVYDFSDH